MRKGGGIWLSVLLIAAVLICGCRKKPEPDKPFVMTLQLAKREWRVGEAPWYLLQAENAGSKKRYLDPFWYGQDKLDENSDYRTATGSKGHDTYFEIRDPAGKVIVPNCLAAWGYHREFRFWGNAEGEPDKWPLKPGQTITATPTVVAPVRKELRKGLGPADARVPANATLEERKAYGGLWKQYKDELESLGMPNDATLDPRILYPGYRVLECYFFRKPGVYRMKAIMDKSRNPTPSSAEEDLALSAKRLGRPVGKKMEEHIRREWDAKTPEELERIREDRARNDRLAQEHPELLPDFILESNIVEFEVVP